MPTKEKKLEWDEKYSVGVKLIDHQHQLLFDTINELIDAINTTPTQEKLEPIIYQLIQYKKFHFATEEKYFDEFKYEKSEEHKNKHKMFGEKITEMQNKYQDDIFSFAFELVDFLEDWLIAHLMTADQDYKACFQAHGLK